MTNKQKLLKLAAVMEECGLYFNLETCNICDAETHELWFAVNAHNETSALGDDVYEIYDDEPHGAKIFNHNDIRKLAEDLEDD